MASIDVEMAATNSASIVPVWAHTSTAPALATQKVRVEADWSLPTDTLAQLVRPLGTVVDELLGPAPIAATAAGAAPARAPDNAFTSAFRSTANAMTSKGGAAFKDTGSSLVDLDFSFKPPAVAESLRPLLEAAWAEDPVATLRIIFQARSVHEGKGYKEGFWVASGWLWEKHPRTFLANLHLLVDPTCKREASIAAREAKDRRRAANDNGILTLDDDGEVEKNLDEIKEYLNDLLVLAVKGQLNASYTGSPDVDEAIVPASLRGVFSGDRIGRKASGGKRTHAGFKTMGRLARGKEAGSFAHAILTTGSKKMKHQVLGKRIETMLRDDKKFQALFLTITHLWVDRLRADVELLDQHRSFLTKPAEERKPFNKETSPARLSMSFAAKWAATPAKSADRQTRLASAIAYLLFPGEGLRTGRELLQRRVLTPLRAVLQVTESRMGPGQWSIDYTKVPARCMARNSNNFMAHDPKGFEAYLMRVAKGKASISGATMMPHEILMDAVGSDPIRKRIADLQWNALVDSIRSAGGCRLENSLAIADVSGSMGHYLAGDKKHPQPINVCVALTLLLGEVSVAPWNGMFFTFSSEPTAEFIDPSQPLSVRAAQLSQAHWEMSTQFHRVFELILDTAEREKLAPEQMVKKLFVFSDMQFDAAVKTRGETEYAAIKRRFEEKGYNLPEVVFWNLQGGGAAASVPVKADQEGVSLMSGFSGAMMKYFLSAQAEKEDAALADAFELDFEQVEVGSETGRGVAAVDKAAKVQVKPQETPLQRLLKNLAAESFKGSVVVD